MKNNFENYTREQLLQIIENKDEEIEYLVSEFDFFIKILSGSLIFLSLIVIYFYGLKL